ncbi:DUF4124 domain-containing protein [Photobacterium sp. BZF1]|uniref:DUF4124 domain-containing protein n=1 Tax=Photobacterium sp. BZF1 TaxID=1904457 RepID=UPI001653C928|nr:DUF4124 domain-containing protein [Photobacterium sp. BZF1]MBC7003256.1 DUF4124 domain-containing protein [Photobacterium sp. BZF1]
MSTQADAVENTQNTHNPEDTMYRLPHVLAAMLVALAALPTTTPASEIYTWQDEDGTTHFSDKPYPGAERLDIQLPAPAMPLFTKEEPTPTGLSAIGDPLSDEPALPSPSIQINSPADQQTIRDNQGNLTIIASANRKLSQGHSAQLRLNGEVYGRSQAQLTWHLTNIDRGSQTLQVELLKHGKVIASSKEMTVFLHRARINQRPAPLPVPK